MSMADDMASPIRVSHDPFEAWDGEEVPTLLPPSLHEPIPPHLFGAAVRILETCSIISLTLTQELPPPLNQSGDGSFPRRAFEHALGALNIPSFRDHQYIDALLAFCEKMEVITYTHSARIRFHSDAAHSILEQHTPRHAYKRTGSPVRGIDHIPPDDPHAR